MKCPHCHTKDYAISPLRVQDAQDYVISFYRCARGHVWRIDRSAVPLKVPPKVKGRIGQQQRPTMLTIPLSTEPATDELHHQD